MATKAGRATLKDLKAGKTFWLVRAGWGEALVDDDKGGNRLSLTWCHQPERMEILERPWRSMTDYSPSAVSNPTPDWSFRARVYFEHEHVEELVYDCSSYGIPTPEHPQVQATFIFVTRKAAQRYFEHVKSANYQTLFEHPAQWKPTGLRKRVSTLYNGRRAVYGDIPTRTNSHRPWLHLRPTEFLMGGMVMDQHTPQSTREHFQRESARELAMMYPHTIDTLIDPSLGVVKHFSDVHLGVTPKEQFKGIENFFKDFWEQFPTPEAQKAHIHDDGVRKLYPGQVIIPGDLMPEQRAQLEKDFVILDEAHIIDPPGTSFVKLDVVDPQKEPERYQQVSDNNLRILGIDPAGPTLTKVVIGNGDKITHVETFPKKEDE